MNQQPGQLQKKHNNLVELVGLPGSGKSTLAREMIAQTGTYREQHALLRSAAYNWLKSESCKGRLLAHLLGGRYAEHRYFSTDVHARNFLRKNSELANTLSAWLATLPVRSGVQYLGRMATLIRVLSVANLIDDTRLNQVVLFDEHWFQFLTVVVSDGEDEQYLLWLQQILPLVTLPECAIMLTGASQVAVTRQNQRGKFATLMDGPFDKVKMGEEIERRLLKAAKLLQTNGLPILLLDSNAPVSVNAQMARQWLRGLSGR